MSSEQFSSVHQSQQKLMALLAIRPRASVIVLSSIQSSLEPAPLWWLWEIPSFCFTWRNTWLQSMEKKESAGVHSSVCVLSMDHSQLTHQWQPVPWNRRSTCKSWESWPEPPAWFNHNPLAPHPHLLLNKVIFGEFKILIYYVPHHINFDIP